MADGLTPWPDLAQDAAGERPTALAQAEYQARLTEAGAIRANERYPTAAELEARGHTEQIASFASDRDLYKAVSDARLDVAKAAIDRAAAAATGVSTAAAAIGTIYTTLLGTTFAIDKMQLPTRGLIAGLYLAAALVFASAYGAFLRTGASTPAMPSGATLTSVHEARLNTFTRWTAEIAQRNAWCLYTSLFCLGAGVAALPLAFLKMSNLVAWVLALGVLCAIFFEAHMAKRKLSRRAEWSLSGDEAVLLHEIVCKSAQWLVPFVKGRIGPDTVSRGQASALQTLVAKELSASSPIEPDEYLRCQTRLRLEALAAKLVRLKAR